MRCSRHCYRQTSRTSRNRRTATLVSVAVALTASSVALGVAATVTPASAAPDGSGTVTLAYVTSFAANDVAVIDTATGTVIATIPVGTGPEGVAFTPDRTRAYIPNQTSATVSVIGTATNSVVATIPVGAQPFGVAVTPDGTEAYVANQGPGTVSVIATATNIVTATIPVGSGPYGVAVTPDGTEAYVANQGSGSVSVIATATGTVTATIPVGTNPSLVAVAPDGTKAYVSNLVSGTVSVIATATNTVIATIAVGTNPRGVVFSPDGTRAYVAQGTLPGAVSVIDTASNSVTASIPVGAVSAIVALTPDGSQLYVTDSGANTVTVVDTATDTVHATIVVGGNPAGVGVAAVPTARGLTIFYAVPSSDGSTVTVAGLIHDAPNTAYSLQVNATPGCASTGAPYGVPNIPVTTNTNGDAYFDDTYSAASGLPSFVYLLSANPLDLSNCYPVGADNTAWENAVSIPLTGGSGSTEGLLAQPGQSRWYKFQATPDSRVTVTLSGLSDDYAVAVYGDIGQASASVPESVSGLNQLNAESASSTFSASAFIPSAFIPSAFIPSAFIPSAFIPSAFIPSAFIPSAFIPERVLPVVVLTLGPAAGRVHTLRLLAGNLQHLVVFAVGHNSTAVFGQCPSEHLQPTYLFERPQPQRDYLRRPGRCGRQDGDGEHLAINRFGLHPGHGQQRR